MRIVEINRLIKKHIEPHVPQYQIDKDLVFKIENDFFLKGYSFQSSGNGEYDLTVAYFIQPLFVKSDCLYLTFGDRLTYTKKINWFRSKQLSWWDATKENLDSSFQSILKSLHNKGEPFMTKIKTATDFYNQYNSDKKNNIRIYEAVAYSTVLFTNEQRQTNLLKGLIELSKTKIHRDTDWVDKIREDTTMLLNKPTTDNRLEILKQWRLETLRFLNLPQQKQSSSDSSAS